MDELKACPFCGGEAEFVRKPIKTKGDWCDAVYVRCKSCDARTNRILYNALQHPNGEEYKQAVVAWNRRTQPENKQYDPEFCTGCRSVDNDADDYPCNECRRAYTDKFEPEQEEK